MTNRIDRLSTEQGLVLRISGRLAEEDLDLIRMAIDGRRSLLKASRSTTA